MSRMDQIREIVETKGYAEIDGFLVDIMTASLLLQCHEKGSDKTKHAIESAPLDKVAATAWKVAAA
jgi:hypothetical protein